MKIKHKQNMNEIPLYRLAHGDVFYFDGKYYIYVCDGSVVERSVVDLVTGDLVTFGPNYLVIHVPNATLHLEG